MNDLTSILGLEDKGKDLIDRLMILLERQTDHKLSPNMLLGFLGMFNMLSVMSIMQSGVENNIKEIPAASNEQSLTKQSLNDTLAGLMNGQSQSQPDLMGILNNVASKKKINPGLLLSLFSMLNNQSENSQDQAKNRSDNEGKATVDEKAEKKIADEKRNVELKYDRKRGVAEKT